MYRPNVLKQRLHNGDKLLGCWTMLGHPQVVEILSLAGFDYLVLDQEHGLGDATSLAAQLHAMSATPTVGVVRVPWNDHVYLKRVLDVGAEAVLVPSVDTADEATVKDVTQSARRRPIIVQDNMRIVNPAVRLNFDHGGSAIGPWSRRT